MLKRQLECLGENIEKCINFSIKIQKEIKNENTRVYEIRFTDSARFMSSSLSSLVDNLPYKKECKDCVCRLKYEQLNIIAYNIITKLLSRLQ